MSISNCPGRWKRGSAAAVALLVLILSAPLCAARDPSSALTLADRNDEAMSSLGDAEEADQALRRNPISTRTKVERTKEAKNSVQDAEEADQALRKLKEDVQDGNSTALSDITKGMKDSIEAALIKEFGNETKKDPDALGRDFNDTAAEDENSIETVVRISANEDHEDAVDENDEKAGGDKEEPMSAAEVIEDASMERTVDRIIDRHDNVFILSTPNLDGDVASLTVDAQLMVDITLVLVTSATFGALFELIRQPTINGYLVAGALVGPGGLNLIKELVQVESLAQLGVSLLLFGLGMELDLSRLQALWGVTILGGAIEIFLFMALGGGIAAFAQTPFMQGVFIGAILSMSSTSVVVKALESTKTHETSFGHITIGTLILQDMSVGLMFALMPVFKPLPVVQDSLDEQAEVNAAILLLVLRMLFKLIVALGTAYLIASNILPVLLKLLSKKGTHELAQLSMVAFCLAAAYIFGQAGLSEELGAFVGGTMISTANKKLEDATLDRHSIESMHNVMAALFVASISLIISPRFLWQHIIILTTSTLLMMLVKCMLIGAVVSWFGYNLRTSLAVGISMAHLGEFSFILLSLGREFKILTSQVYMLLLGIAALSLLAAPFIINMVAVVLGTSDEGGEAKPGQSPLLPCFPGAKPTGGARPTGWFSNGFALLPTSPLTARKSPRVSKGTSVSDGGAADRI